MRIPFIGLRTYGSSYSPLPSCHPSSVLVYSGSGPRISSSLTVNGLITQSRRSSSRRSGKQQIHSIFTASGTYTSNRLQTPSPSSSSGTERLSLESVPQLVSLRSGQPSLSSSRSSTRSNVQFAESVRYLQVNSSGIESLSVSSHAVGFFGNLSIGSPMLSPSSSSSMWLHIPSKSMSSGKEEALVGSVLHSSSIKSGQPSPSSSVVLSSGQKMSKSTL